MTCKCLHFVCADLSALSFVSLIFLTLLCRLFLSKTLHFRIKNEELDFNARVKGDFLKNEIGKTLGTAYPQVIDGVQGMGCMLGIRLKGAAEIPKFATNTGTPSSIQFVNVLHELGVLTVPAGENIVRLLPPLNFQQSEAEEALEKIEAACKRCS